MNGHKKLSVLIICDTTHNQIGGTEINTLGFANFLYLKSVDVTLVEVGEPLLSQSGLIQGSKIITIKTTNFESIPFETWKHLIQENRVDYILLSKTWIGCMNRYLDFATFFSNARYLAWEHHPSTAKSLSPSEKFKGVKSFIAKAKRKFRLAIYKYAVKKTLTVSHAVAAPLIEFYKFSPKKIHTIYPGVEFNRYIRTKEDRRDQRKKWGIPDNALVIGSLGRLVPHKGNDFILEVFSKLYEPHKNLWCVIAGKGPDLDRLREIAKQLNISERVIFPGWQDDAALAWNCLDFFLMPSQDEGLGMTLIEAVAGGCIPLCSDVGGMKEVLNDSLSECCLQHQNLDEWLNKLVELINSESKRNSLRSTAYAQLHQKFDANQQWTSMMNWLFHQR